MEPPTRRHSLLAVIIAALTVAACSSSGAKPAVQVRSDDASSASATTTSTTTTAPDRDPTGNAQAWVDAIDSGKPATVEKAVALSKPGSPAHAYATYKLSEAQGFQQAGQAMDTYRTSVQDDGSIHSCPPSGKATDCVIFADFVADPDGLISSLSVQGNALEGRAVEGGEPASVNGATITPLAAIAFNTADGTGVAFKVEAADKLVHLSVPFGASYVGANGVQAAATPDGSAVPSMTIQPGANVTMTLSFPGATLGGTLTVNVCPDDFRGCADVKVAI